MPNRYQRDSEYHHGDVFHRPVSGGGVLHGIAVELHIRADKVQNQADQQLGMCRYHGEQVDEPVAVGVGPVTKPACQRLQNGHQHQQRYNVPEPGVQVQKEAI